MTKPEFLNWLNQFKFVSHIRDLVEQRTFTEEELDFIAKNLVAKKRVLKVRRHGA